MSLHRSRSLRALLGPATAACLLASACGGDDGAATADPAEFCRLNASIDEAATTAAAGDPTAAIAAFRAHLADLDRMAVVAPAELAAQTRALVGATKKAVELDNIGTLLADGPAMAAKVDIDGYCTSTAG